MNQSSINQATTLPSTPVGFFTDTNNWFNQSNYNFQSAFNATSLELQELELQVLPSNTGNTAVSLPASNTNSVTISHTAFDHSLDRSSGSSINECQILWSNGAFHSPPNNIPYIDYTTDGYRVGANDLKNYSAIGTTLQNYTITHGQTAREYWWNQSSSVLIGTAEANMRWLAFKVTVPPVVNNPSAIVGVTYELIIKDKSGNTLNQSTSNGTTPNGYWLMHYEVTRGSGTSNTQFTPRLYNGQYQRNALGSGCSMGPTGTTANRFFYNVDTAIATDLVIYIGVPKTTFAGFDGSIKSIAMRFYYS